MARMAAFFRNVWWFRPWNRVRVLWIEDYVVTAQGTYPLWLAVIICCFCRVLDWADRRLGEQKPPAEFVIIDL